MSDNTGIQWTDTTWNPIRGCTRVSQGCVNCYAEAIARRFSGPGQPYEGLVNAQGRWNGTIEFVDKLLTKPLTWRKPRRVFVNSMSDLFHENVHDDTIDCIFAVMALARLHTFQILTKRPERMRAYMAAPGVGQRVLTRAKRIKGERGDIGFFGLFAWPLPNVWLLVSAEDQPTFDARVPHLLQTPAAVRGVSLEPLLGPISLGLNLGVPLADGTRWSGSLPLLDWVIVGGESGPSARPCDVRWARSIVEHCRSAGVACFVKQLGAKPTMRHHVSGQELLDTLYLKDRKGGDMAEWPEDLRVRQFPCEVRP